ncbi:ribonuclease III [Phlegmacium glaucopus]|nr:ribonuclease III [Phlegmacium glaucopus]
MPVGSLNPDFGKDDVFFPKLPEIHSPAIKSQVFTHRSYYARQTHVFEDLPNDPSPDNEKYEHLGDTVLGMTVTHLLMKHFPSIRVGPSTKIRSLIVGNPNLAEMLVFFLVLKHPTVVLEHFTTYLPRSLKYKLPDSLRLHPAQAITLRTSARVQADVFEAFIGGLFLDQGLEVVRAWIEPLFKPYALAAYQIVRQQHGLPAMPPSSMGGDSRLLGRDPLAPSQGFTGSGELFNTTTIGHLALFNQHLQKANKQVEWIYSSGDPGYADMGLSPDLASKGTKTTPVWYVDVMVDGIFHGRGRANTKKAARNEAAKEGLQMLGIVVCVLKS